MQVEKTNFLELLSSVKIKSMTASLHVEKQLVNTGKQKQTKKIDTRPLFLTKCLKDISNTGVCSVPVLKWHKLFQVA